MRASVDLLGEASLLVFVSSEHPWRLVETSIRRRNRGSDEFLENLCPIYGGFHSHGGTPIARWLIMERIFGELLSMYAGFHSHGGTPSKLDV